MALIQRYSTELSTHATTTNNNTSIAHVADDIASIKKHDEDEKRYFHSLNDRLEEFLRSLNVLELANKKLRDELNLLITSWGISGENRARFLQELDHLTKQLSEYSRRKVLLQAETKIFEEETHLIDRVTAVFIDVIHLYEDKKQILFHLIQQLEDEYHKIKLRLDISNTQVKSCDDDYQKELAKFRTYLAEWSQIALDKQKLIIEIQTLREHYNLRLAYNQEEINEWKRLLNRISQESKNFYKDYLETIKQQIYSDYEKMAKEQQMDVEMELKTRLTEIQEKINMGVPLDENEERRRREETHRFETRLNEFTQEHDRLQSDFRKLAEEAQRKRRLLQDLENEARNKARKHAEQHARLIQDTDFTRAEYYALKDELDKMAYTLRFSIEEELRIYETLLNSLNRQKDEPRPSIDESTGFRHTKTTTTTTKTKADTGDDVIKYRQPSISTTTYNENTDQNRFGIAQSMLNQNQTTTKTTTRTIRRGGGGGQESDGRQQQINVKMEQIEQEVPELNEKYMQSKIHITRKYKGNVLIKFVDVGGRFVEVENTGNHTRDLTGWYIERVVDGRHINYMFPNFELDSHKTVRIYGNYHQRSAPIPTDDSYVQLIASNFYDWGTGRQMRTELFNRDDVGKALFEQTIKE
ncbi:unnamed protein product [Adineta steineri]|uniref:LTD domain-containing protein n=1 Tax=Adineta steineri TaxID=433720 RepID=A0A814RFS5_9BILA|nr:unnamed protein product [Adineta steineri]CAF3585021.1 unnamed protein product [Adineta steineri]